MKQKLIISIKVLEIDIKSRLGIPEKNRYYVSGNRYGFVFGTWNAHNLICECAH